MRASLETKPREKMSGGALNQLRREGFVPASISQGGHDSQQCLVPWKELSDIFSHHGKSALIELKGETGKRGIFVISRDIQKDPVSGKILHVGFQRLLVSKPTTADVRLRLFGEPEDVHNGNGVLDQVASTVKV